MCQRSTVASKWWSTTMRLQCKVGSEFMLRCSWTAYLLTLQTFRFTTDWAAIHAYVWFLLQSSPWLSPSYCEFRSSNDRGMERRSTPPCLAFCFAKIAPWSLYERVGLACTSLLGGWILIFFASSKIERPWLDVASGWDDELTSHTDPSYKTMQTIHLNKANERHWSIQWLCFFFFPLLDLPFCDIQRSRWRGKNGLGYISVSEESYFFRNRLGHSLWPSSWQPTILWPIWYMA